MFKSITITATTLVAISLFFGWVAEHDKKVAEAAQKYEECVKKEYGRTPVQVYVETGFYPKCPANNEAN